MKRLIVNKKIIFFSFFIALTGFGAHKVCEAVFSVLQARWYFDERLSDLAQKSVIRYAHNQNYNDFAAFSATLQKKFLMIKNLTMCQDTAGIVTVKVESITPKVRINDKWVATADGVQVRSYFFDDDLVYALPTLRHAQGERRGKAKKPRGSKRKKGSRKRLKKKSAFFSWLKNTPVQLLEKYNVTWVDRFHVWFQDKKEKRFVLLSSAQKNITEQLDEKVAHIKNKLVDRGAFLRTRYNWIADLRFKDHIIVFRGAENGTGIG